MPKEHVLKFNKLQKKIVSKTITLNIYTDRKIQHL